MSLKHTEQQRLASYSLWGKGKVGAYIDRGSFGQVYELYGLNADGKADALKIVTIEYTEEAKQRGEEKQKYLLNGLRSMLDEIQRMMELKQLNNFVSIYDYEDYPIRENGELIGYDILIRMEKLTVLTKYLEERRAQNMPVTERDILQIGIDVCTGLQEANLLVQKESHRAEFIHRDIKPENIFVAADGTYKLGDLGIATMNQRTQYSTVGTPSYMAPEMFLERGYLGLTSKPGYNTFDLDGAYQTFTATYFVQSDVDTNNSIRFRVLADDDLIYDSGEKTLKGEAEQIIVDIRGAKQLTIQVEEQNRTPFVKGPSVIVADAVLKKPFELKTQE